MLSIYDVYIVEENFRCFYGVRRRKIGLIESVVFSIEDDWVYLEYKNGEKYPHSCNSQPRLAHIMILCDPLATQVAKITCIIATILVQV